MIFEEISFPLFLLLSLLSQGIVVEGDRLGLGPPPRPRSSTSLFQLHSRQADAMPLGSIPPECQASCQPYLDISNTCVASSSSVNITCLCSDTSANALLQCAGCIVNSSIGPIFAAEEQPKLDNLSAACQELGLPFNETLQVPPAQSSSSVALSTISLSVSQLTSLVFVLVYLTAMRI